MVSSTFHQRAYETFSNARFIWHSTDRICRFSSFLSCRLTDQKKKKWARQLLIRSVTKRRSKVIYLLSVHPCKNTKLCLTNVFILCGIKYLTKRVLAQKSIVNHHRSVLSARGKKQPRTRKKNRAKKLSRAKNHGLGKTSQNLSRRSVFLISSKNLVFQR